MLPDHRSPTTRHGWRYLSAATTMLGLVWLLAACASDAPPKSEPAPSGMRITFWAMPDATPPPGAVEKRDNPCGTTYTLATNRVIRNDPALEPSMVHEITAGGEIQRSWAVPVDLVPVAVDGQNLLLRRRSGGDGLLEVGSDGSVASRSLPSLASPEPGACPPRPAEEYAAGVQCVTAYDLSSRKQLLLEFEGPCN